MKSAMPYYGVPAPAQQAIWNCVLPVYPLKDAASWRETVLALWRGARFREERYAALALTGLPAHAPHQTLDVLSLYEELIVTGAWWDYVDLIAGKRVGLLLRLYATPMKRTLRRWSRDGDMWKRRTAILAQLSFKGNTDLALLKDCIEPNLDDTEFFIRKAIGWALRQYAWTNPAAMRRYVAQHRTRLSGLSRREALRNVGG